MRRAVFTTLTCAALIGLLSSYSSAGVHQSEDPRQTLIKAAKIT